MCTSEDVSGPVRRSPARFLEKHRGRNAMELVKLAICPKNWIAVYHFAILEMFLVDS